MRAQWSEARAFRLILVYHEHLGPGETDARGLHVINDLCPPAKVLPLIETIIKEGLLTRQQGSLIEEKLLARVSAEGRWIM
jgi:hypothetical protein